MGWTPPRPPHCTRMMVSNSSERKNLMNTIGLDLAKRVFQAHGADASGNVLFRKRLRRERVLEFFSTLPPSIVAMEACGGSHYWAREIGRFGHDVFLIPPAYVKPFVKRQKNDAADAEAICEAAQRPTMRRVAVKSEGQQAATTVFRARDLLVRERTQIINALRGHLAEYGIVVPQGTAHVSKLIEHVNERRCLRQLAWFLAYLSKRSPPWVKRSLALIRRFYVARRKTRVHGGSRLFPASVR